MRTTIRLDEGLLRDAKRAAAESGRTLTSLIEDALREKLAHKHDQGVTQRKKLPTYPGWGLRPGVDLNNTAALLDLMEDTDGPP